jgi:hypothetical protein
MEDLDLAALRELLRVPPGKLERFADLNRKALQPALLEVKALAPFEVHARERMQGKRVVGVTLGWAFKNQARKDAAWREVQRPRVGRRARLRGLTEHMVDAPVDEVVLSGFAPRPLADEG